VYDGVDSVSVSLIGAPGDELLGPTTVPVVRGRAVFDDIRIPRVELSGTPRLSFLAGELDGVLSAPLLTTRSLEMTRLSVNGEPVDLAAPIVRVASSAPIDGTCDFVYSSPHAAASIIMGYTPTWGAPAAAWRDIGPLVTPVREQALSDVRFHLNAPSDPGSYHILFAFAAETAPEFLFSATNWVLGEPVWGDGNDIGAWSAETIAETQDSGLGCSQWLFQSRDGTRWYEQNCIPAAVIQIRVTAPQ
jgi:hypothetical protein